MIRKRYQAYHMTLNLLASIHKLDKFMFYTRELEILLKTLAKKSDSTVVSLTH